jgi:hypothetical protein
MKHEFILVVPIENNKTSTLLYELFGGFNASVRAIDVAGPFTISSLITDFQSLYTNFAPSNNIIKLIVYIE